jgi:hypothetical protein
MPKRIQPIELHQLLAWKYPGVKSIKDACAVAAKDYGLTSETMRTYVYSGIGFRSKSFAAISADVEDMKRFEESGWRMVSESERQLAAALQFHITTMRSVAEQFQAIKTKIEQRMQERRDA